MRILHVIRTLDPAWGGPVEGVRNLAKQALIHGHHVEILCADDPASPWLASWNIQTHGVGAGHLKKYGFAVELDRWLAENIRRFDVVVVQGIWMYFGYAVWKITRGTGVPYFLFIHGALDPWFRKRYPLKHLKKTLYWKTIEHKVLRDAERVLFTTQEELALADQAFHPYQCRAEVSGYGITPPELDKFNKRQWIEDLTIAHPQLGNRNFLLFLARIHEKKGIDLLLKAYSAAKRELADTALVIAGPGDDKTISKLRHLASSLGVADDVVWTGPLYRDAKWHALQAAEAYILPSHQENFGISVAEALACGTPVLISDKVNIWREIASANAGLVQPDDIEGTTILLRSWAAMRRAEKARMRMHAKDCFARHFDITVTSELYLSLLRAGVPRYATATA